VAVDTQHDVAQQRAEGVIEGEGSRFGPYPWPRAATSPIRSPSSAVPLR
jgi:hypothetical protein